MFCADFHGDTLICAGFAALLWAISDQNFADVGAQPINCQCAKFNFCHVRLEAHEQYF